MAIPVTVSPNASHIMTITFILSAGLLVTAKQRLCRQRTIRCVFSYRYILIIILSRTEVQYVQGRHACACAYRRDVDVNRACEW